MKRKLPSSSNFHRSSSPHIFDCPRHAALPYHSCIPTSMQDPRSDFMSTNDSSRQLLRHTLATLAYRAGKTVRDAPASFATFSTGEKGRTPAHILAHMGDLFDWALSIAQGKQAWQDSAPLPWPQEVARFFRTLQAFDDFLASGAPLAATAEKLL